MIRPFTAVCVLLAAGSGLYLYTEKHRTTVLDQQISQIIQNTRHVRERTAMLRAEWALLNQPDRLQSLASRFLPELHPMAPAQFVQMVALSQRLPEIAPPATAPAPAPALLLPPQQVMASSLATVDRRAAGDERAAEDAGDAVPAPDRRAWSRGASPAADTEQRARHTRGLPHPVQMASVTLRHPAMRAQAPLRTVLPATAHTAPASRLASYEGGAVRSLLSTAGYSRPAPIAASWHPPRRPVMLPATISDAPGVNRSSLGFSHAALSAPVPVQDGQ